jgi:hypothetical protein
MNRSKNVIDRSKNSLSRRELDDLTAKTCIVRAIVDGSRSRLRRYESIPCVERGKTTQEEGKTIESVAIARGDGATSVREPARKSKNGAQFVDSVSKTVGFRSISSISFR